MSRDTEKAPFPYSVAGCCPCRNKNDDKLPDIFLPTPQIALPLHPAKRKCSWKQEYIFRINIKSKKGKKIMKVKVNAIAMITMVTVGFTTVATSCSNDDVPASYQPSVLAKSLEGEWIVEQHIDGIEGLGKMAENIYIPEDADQFAILYHFNNDGTGWKELDLLKNGKVESILISRYDSQFVYTVSNEGKVSLNYTDADGKMNGQKAELLFDGKILTDKTGDIPVALNPSTEAQIKTYQEEADAWHGGSDDAALGHALFDSVVGEIVGSDGKWHTQQQPRITCPRA